MTSLNPDPDLKKTLVFIREMADYDDLELIRAELVKRAGKLRMLKTAKVRENTQVGDRVLLTGVKPQYLNGRVGKVLEFVDGNRVRVDFGDPIRRYGRIIKVPLSSIEVLK